MMFDYQRNDGVRMPRTMPEHFGQYKNDHFAATSFHTFKFFTPKATICLCTTKSVVLPDNG